jgi:signal transduction histidine kinase
MRERVRQLGGTLEVQSQATGTIVSATLKIG